MAAQLVAEMARQHNHNLTNDAGKISIMPINSRSIYQWDLPIDRSQFQQVERSRNYADAQQWLMEHDRNVFVAWLATTPE